MDYSAAEVVWCDRGLKRKTNSMKSIYKKRILTGDVSVVLWQAIAPKMSLPFVQGERVIIRPRPEGP